MSDFSFKDDEARSPAPSSSQPPTPPQPPVPPTPPVAPSPPVVPAPAPVAPSTQAISSTQPKVPAPASPPSTQNVAPAPPASAPQTPPAPKAPAPASKAPAQPEATPKTPPTAPAASQRATVSTQGAHPHAPKPTAPEAPADPAAKPDGGMPATGELARNQMKTSAREYVEGRPAWQILLERIEPFVGMLMTASLVISGLVIAYLLYAIYGQNIGGARGNELLVADTIGKVAMGLRASLILLAISLAILMFDVKAVGLVMAVLGFALSFGAPIAAKSLGGSAAMGALAIQMIAAGRALLFIGLTKYALNMASWLGDLPNRIRQTATVGIARMAEPAQQRRARDAHMFSPCWDLPFCREVIRKQCPAFLAKKRCWKFGRGCYCDEEMISRIVRGESQDKVKAPTRLTQQGKPPCGRCYIFLEHQNLKYKSLAWLAIPLTACLAFFGWPIYQGLFNLATVSMSALWQRLALGGANVAANTAGNGVTSIIPRQDALSVYELTPEQMQHTAMVMFGIVLGFFLLIYVSKTIEWAIYKAKF